MAVRRLDEEVHLLVRPEVDPRELDLSRSRASDI
jgi:hypothetical protein